MTIHIFRDGVWAGTGTIDQGGEIECSAVLGETQDDSDEAYQDILDAIDAEAESATRPDGEYTWVIE